MRSSGGIPTGEEPVDLAILELWRSGVKHALAAALGAWPWVPVGETATAAISALERQR
jgi:hypothetical protein